MAYHMKGEEILHHPSQFESTDSHRNWYAPRRTHLIGGRGAALDSFPQEESDAALVWRAILAPKQLCSLKRQHAPHKSVQPQ